ncbi:uncharacterized protein LOC123452700 [Hordeum vulgare subsp. vulgare]|uniref:F-box domain-containing protein n=2 Tax=Hordeum vulgare subsp. vulgare TaxID=112509 RepID=A0A8I7BFK3_HORVV|nr:uncharacterized protein LOC123452700 [Hordeum vulgare subsp. vulgare]
MPPQSSPWPELCRDVLEQVFILLPPHDPGSLIRASLVCRPWRAFLTSPGFARRYREFHRTPPLLGFFENHDTVMPWFAPSSPSASPFPPLFPDRRNLYVLDSRHALVLLRNPIRTDVGDHAVSLIVWDPVGRRQWEFPPPDFASTVLYDVGVVVCAADHCDHLACHGSSFLVGYVGTGYSSAYASVFSSETNSWSPTVSCSHPDIQILICQPKPLVGNAAYSICVSEDEEYDEEETDEDEDVVLRFDLFSRELSKFDGPPIHRNSRYVLMKTEEGVLGCATMQGSRSRLHLWSTETGPDGAVAWMQRRVVDLHKLLPSNTFFSVIGFEDRAGAFYLMTYDGVTTVDLKSGRVKKISIDNSSIVPYISFYTPDQAGTIMHPSTLASSSENVEVAQDEYRDLLLLRSSGQVGDVGECGGWEEVRDKENEGDEEKGEQMEKDVQELCTFGFKAIENKDFSGAVDCQRRILKTRVAHHGKLSPKCCSAYYNYGCALLRKTQSIQDPEDDPENEFWPDLYLAWKMLHVARAISEKSPGSNMEKYKIFAALAKVSVEIDDTDYSLIACFKALAMLEHLLECDHHHIINLNLQVRFAFELESMIGDAKAISLFKSRIENLKRASEDLLADNGDDASFTEVGSEKSFPAKEIRFLTDTLLGALEHKLEDLEQANINPSFRGKCWSRP